MNKTKSVFPVIAAFFVILSQLTLLAGCATSGYKQADKTGVGIAGFRKEVVGLKKSVDSAMVNLSGVTQAAATDPRKAFEAFNKSVDQVEKARSRASKRAAEVKTAGAAYFKTWEAQLATISNEEIRLIAEQRKAEWMEIFSKFGPMLEEAKNDFDPFLANLRDLRSFLSQDLTVSGVDAANSIIEQTRNDGIELQGALDNLIDELNSLSAILTPASRTKNGGQK